MRRYVHIGMIQKHEQPEQSDEQTWRRTAREQETVTTEDAQVQQLQPEVVGRLGLLMRRDTRRRLVSTVVLPMLPALCLLTIEQVLGDQTWIRLCTNPAFLTAVLVVGVSGPLAMLKPSRKASQAAGRLSELDDVQAIGGLVDSLAFGHAGEADEAVRAALIRLLPHLKASDSTVLTGGQIAVLRSVLGSSPYVTGDLFTRLSRRLDAHARLQIAILKAFEQVGDSQSLPVVYHLATSASNPQVRRAAQECLPFMQARVEHARATQTLLRASSAAGPDPGVLLRPAKGSHEQTADEMVRPSGEPETGTRQVDPIAMGAEERSVDVSPDNIGDGAPTRAATCAA